MINQKKLKEILNYNLETGIFTWKVKQAYNRPTIGKVAGTKTVTGYIRFRYDKREYLAHRLAWLYVHGEYPKVIDHLNGRRDDNRFENLRNTTTKGNAKNRKLGCNNTSGHAGISYQTKQKSWLVTIGNEYVGFFKDKTLAIEARNKAEIDNCYIQNRR